MEVSQDQPTAGQSMISWVAEQMSMLRVQSEAWQSDPRRRLHHPLSRTHSKASVLKPS